MRQIVRSGTSKLERILSEETEETMFSVEELYAYVENYANREQLTQTLNLLPYCTRMHSGQYRKGRKRIPYIIHPLTLARHAIALGRGTDVILSVCLLHDVCEDCGVAPGELPVDEETREAVALLTKSESFSAAGGDNDAYYQKISENRVASLVKVLDRCNNVTGMAAAFSDEKLASYILETREHTLVLLDKAVQRFPEDSEIYFSLRYHILGIVQSLQAMLQRKYAE